MLLAPSKIGFELKKWTPLITGAATIVVLIAGLYLHGLSLPSTVEPARPLLSPPPSWSEELPKTGPSPTPSPNPTTTSQAEETVIESSDITRLVVPNVDIDVTASGETWPRRSERCKGGASECIDPPLLEEVAWYGAYALPSLPSEGSVLIFGHTNSRDADKQAFNNLLEARPDDRVTVTTKTGIFTYQVEQVELVDYATIHLSELVYEHKPDKLVLVTCNFLEDAATVVVAYLEEAHPIG